MIEGLVKPKISENSLIHAKSLDGTNKLRLSADSVEYILSEDQTVFRTEEIFFNGRKEYIFFKLLFTGAVNLYTGKHEVLGKLYYVEIKDNMLVIPKSGLYEYYRTIFNACFDEDICKNCPYTESSIIKVIKQYSECISPDIKVNDNPMNEFRVNYAMGIKLSYNTGGFVFPDNARYAQGYYSNFSDLSVGIVGKANITSNIFIQTEFLVLKKESEADPVITGIRYESFGSTGNGFVDITSNVKFDLTYLDWPVFVGYRFIKGRIKPFLGLGINIGFLLSGQIIDKPYSLDSEDDGPPYYKFNNLDFGLSGLFGIDIPISGKSALQFYVKYVRSTTDYILYRNGTVPGGDGMGSSNLDTNRYEFSLVYAYSLSKNNR